jgi:hypothetical protein
MASVRMRSWRPLELAGHVRAGRRAVPPARARRFRW